MRTDSKNIKTAFGRKLRSIRTSKQLPQEKLAELADLDRTYISSVELGKRNISIVNICRLASALDIKIKYFPQTGRITEPLVTFADRIKN